MKRQMKDGDEYDAFSKWGRKYLLYLQRVGVRKKIKQRVNRRERRQVNQDLWKENQ